MVFQENPGSQLLPLSRGVDECKMFVWWNVLLDANQRNHLSFLLPPPQPSTGTSWSGAVHLIFRTFLHPISVFFSQHVATCVAVVSILYHLFLVFLLKVIQYVGTLEIVSSHSNVFHFLNTLF